MKRIITKDDVVHALVERGKLGKAHPTPLYKTVQVSLGQSDISELVFRFCCDFDGHIENTLKAVRFGSDGDYKAYVTTEHISVPDHYEFICDGSTWLTVYDDDTAVAHFKADGINVYRAGDYGCIIMLV